MTRVAAVVVTHNSARWLPATLSSILQQSRQPDRIVVVDDGSTDDTREIVDRMTQGSATVLPAVTTASDVTTRIAANFRQGIQEVSDCDIAVLGDHDDLWHPNRVGHQAGVLEVLPDECMLASDGRLVNEGGSPLGGTLRSRFPVGLEWKTASSSERMRAALRRSIATGGASAVRPAALASVEIPIGWLHDRWWSLVATAAEHMLVDDAMVIDYRVSRAQQVGLDSGHQGRSPVGRLFAGAQNLGETLARWKDLRSLDQYATESVRAEFATARLLQTMV